MVTVEWRVATQPAQTMQNNLIYKGDSVPVCGCVFLLLMHSNMLHTLSLCVGVYFCYLCIATFSSGSRPNLARGILTRQGWPRAINL